MLFSSYIGCLIIGYIIFQSQIFIPNLAVFQFVISGAMAASFFTLLRYTTFRNSLAGYFVICIFMEGLLMKSPTAEYILRDILYFAVIGFAVYLYWRYSYKTNLLWNRPLQFAGYFAVLNIVMTVVLLFINNQLPQLINALALNMSISFLVGLGLGIGIEAGNYFIKKLPAVEEEQPIAEDNKS